MASQACRVVSVEWRRYQGDAASDAAFGRDAQREACVQTAVRLYGVLGARFRRIDGRWKGGAGALGEDGPAALSVAHARRLSRQNRGVDRLDARAVELRARVGNWRYSRGISRARPIAEWHG